MVSLWWAYLCATVLARGAHDVVGGRRADFILADLVLLLVVLDLERVSAAN